MAARISEAPARGTRTLGQGGAGWVITEAIEAFGIYDFSDRQYGLAVFVIGAVIAFAQALIENRMGKGFLRQIPPTTVPVPGTDDGDGLEPTPEPVQTDNSPRPEDPVDQPPQDPDFIPPSDDIEPGDEAEGDLS